MTSRVARHADEYEHLVREQMRFLRTSARLFDAGDAGEAKRIATTLRVLLYTSRTSHALLEQSGHRSRLRFYDSAGGLNPRNLLAQDLLTLVQVKVTGPGTVDSVYLPSFSSNGPPPHRFTVSQQVAALARGVKLPRERGQHLPLAEWWDAPVIRDATGTDFTRGDLIKALANEDGGAHVDPGLRAAHHALSRSNSLGWYSGDNEKALGSPIPASVRQIAHEVERTIKQQAPDLVP